MGTIDLPDPVDDVLSSDREFGVFVDLAAPLAAVDYTFVNDPDLSVSRVAIYNYATDTVAAEKTGLSITGGETVTLDGFEIPAADDCYIVSDDPNGQHLENESPSFPYTDSEGVGDVTAGWTLGATTNTSYYDATAVTLTAAPQAPATLSATGAATSVSLSWTDTVGEDGYTIYRAQSSGTTLSDYTQLDTVGADTTSYTDSSVGFGTYYYRVTATYSAGESDPSPEASAIAGPKPTNVQLDATVADELTVSWDDVSGESGYEVHLATSSGVDTTGTPDTTTGADVTTATVTGLADGERYYVRVVAVDSDGDTGPDSDEQDAVTVLPAPTDLSVSNVTANGADLDWTATHDNGDTRVEYKLTSEGSWTTASTVSRTTESASLSGLLDGQAYDVRVVAQTEHTETVDQ